MPSAGIDDASDAAPTGRRAAPLAAGWQAAGLFVLLLAVVVALQWRAGAASGTLQGDASSHYLSSLLVVDWLKAGDTANPMRYLIDYHAHLPSIGIGHWPPLYYGTLALWMLVAGIGTGSVILFSAVMTAAFGLAGGLAAARKGGALAGVLAGLLLVANPLVQRASNELMMDVQCALAMFLAALCYAAYLARGSWRSALGFGLAASAAIMIKGNALALAYLPPLCVLIGRRWDLLRRPSFYAPAGVVAVLTGPWYVATHGLVSQGFVFAWGLDYLWLATGYNLASIVDGLSPTVAALAALGLGQVISHGGLRAEIRPLDIACAALVVAVFLFLLTFPVALQDRYLIPCLPAGVVLAMTAIRRLLPLLRGAALRAVALCVVAGVPLLLALPGQAVVHDGVPEAARLALAALPPGNPVLLAVTDARAETSVISETAARVPTRPVAWVVRGSRLFGGGGYMNSDYTARVTDPDAMLAEIDRYGVAVIVFRPNTVRFDWTHVDAFAALLKARPERLALAGEVATREPIQIFRVVGNAARQPDAALLTRLNGPRALAGQGGG